MKLSARRSAAVTLAACAVVGFGAACSAESAASPPDDALTQCLSDNGVPAPPPGGPGGHEGPPPEGPPPSGPPPAEESRSEGPPPAPPGVDQGTWDSAMQSCRSLAPTPPAR